MASPSSTLRSAAYRHPTRRRSRSHPRSRKPIFPMRTGSQRRSAKLSRTSRSGPESEEGMPVTIVVPQLGESVVEGTVGKWLKKEGDPIAKDEPIVEIITDKINIELPAPAAGKLGKITIPEGTVAQVGQELGVILGQGESPPAGGGGAGAPAGAGATPQRQQGPPARPAPAPNAGAASQGGAPPPEPAPARAGTAVAEPSYADDQRVSPAVRKLVKEHNLDLSGIRGSGMGGRVTREDVLNHIEAGKVAGSAGAP